MILEYALEPDLLNNWKDFRYFTEKFGVARGRLISRYPKHWKRMVYESLAGCGEIDRKRIEEGLLKLDERMMKRSGYWNQQLDWLANAEAEHLQRPFHAILAKLNPNQRAYVLECDSLDERNALWNVHRSRIVARTAGEMAACVTPLLRLCKMVLFIDPHFGPENSRHRRPLEAFLNAILQQRSGEPPRLVEIHTKATSTPEFFKSECQIRLPRVIPRGLRVRLVRWSQRNGGEILHNRYILTDIGGVSFEVGLDDGATGQTDEVKLLEADIYNLRWKQYGSAQPAFDLVDELTIEGRRQL
jgi:hypothetical protein